MENNEKNSPKHSFTLTHLICTLLAIALVFLAVAIYANVNQDKIGKKIAETRASSAAAEGSAASSATPLPSELTTVGSDLILVNKTHPLPAGYEPKDTDLASPYLNSSTDVIKLATHAADAAKEMKAAAANDGITLVVSAGYVSYKEQETLFDSAKTLLGGGDTGPAFTAVEKAGYSEHQTGLAIDFTSDSTQASPTVAFADSDAGKWLYAHAHEYGFILRYPKGKEKVTKYDYMPWHYRYVGKDVAAAMYAISPDETMEEYYNINN